VKSSPLSLKTILRRRSLFRDCLIAEAETLDRFPHQGRLVQRRGNVRKLVCRPYLILYRIAEFQRKRTVEILRFWHGRSRNPAFVRTRLSTRRSTQNASKHHIKRPNRRRSSRTGFRDRRAWNTGICSQGSEGRGRENHGRYNLVELSTSSYHARTRRNSQRGRPSGIKGARRLRMDADYVALLS
jgi:plasmid stabilization system protein ParE